MTSRVYVIGMTKEEVKAKTKFRPALSKLITDPNPNPYPDKLDWMRLGCFAGAKMRVIITLLVLVAV